MSDYRPEIYMIVQWADGLVEITASPLFPGEVPELEALIKTAVKQARLQDGS